MAVIKTLSHLSLSRPASDPAAARTASHGSSVSSTATVVTPPLPHQPTADYHLPDENLVTYEGRRSRSHGGTSRKADPAMITPPAESSGPGALPKPRRHLSLGPSLSSRGKVRSSGHSTAATSHATANGSAALNGSHTTTNRPLLAGLLSASTKSLAPSNGPSPVGTPAVSPSGAVPGGRVKSASLPVTSGAMEASHVGKVGSRLRDLVNRTFPAGPEHGLAHAGRGAPRVTVAAEVGELLRTELTAAKADPYVLRALVRTAIAPALTVFITRLDQLLVLPSDDPATLFIPKTVRDVDSALPQVLQFDIEVVKAAWLVRSPLDLVLRADDAGPVSPRGLVDGLAPFVGKLDAIVQKLMGPYLVTAKASIMGKIATFRLPDSVTPHASMKTLPITLTRSNAPAAPSTATALASGTSSRLRELAANLDALRKLFVVKLACGSDSEKWIVSVASQAVWKGMLAFAARAAPLQTSLKMPPSPPRAHTGSGRGFLKTAQRSPSPPHQSHSVFIEHPAQKDILSEISCFWIIINKFIDGIAGLPEAISMVDRCPDGPKCEFCRQGLSIKLGDDGDLVRDAMNEALEALSASQLVLRAAAKPSSLIPALTPPAPLTVSAVLAGGKEGVVTAPATTGCPTLDRAVDELPPLILIHALASRLSTQVGFRLPHEIWEDSWEDYEGELRGFVAAEQWTSEIATTMIGEVERVKKEHEGKLGQKDLDTLAAIELVARLNSSASQ